MSDTHTACPRCSDVGVADGNYCTCSVGLGRRAAPRLRIGDTILSFPPGTTMEEARSVFDEAKRLYLESLS